MSKTFQTSMSRRALFGGGISLSTALLLASCAKQDGGATAQLEDVVPEIDGDEITFFTWAEYINPELVAEFEAATGVKVNFEYTTGSDATLQKLASGLEYDVVLGNSGYLERMVEGGLVRPFALDRLENFDNIQPYFHTPYYDAGDRQYSTPYAGGITAFMYRTDKVDTPDPSWNGLWDIAQQANGHTFLLDALDETIGTSLLRLGYDLNSADPAQVKEAVDSLIELKPYLAGISNDTASNIGTGEAWVHHAWSVDALIAMGLDEHPLEFVRPSDGAPFGMNIMTIGAKAKAPGAALAFIDFMLSPDATARNAAYIADLSGTVAGDAAFRNEVAADLPAFQVPDDFYDSVMWKLSLTGDRLDLWNSEWNRFKAS